MLRKEIVFAIFRKKNFIFHICFVLANLRDLKFSAIAKYFVATYRSIRLRQLERFT